MRYLPATILALAACSSPTVVVDDSAPTVSLDGAEGLSTDEANAYTVNASAEGRSIHRIGIEARLIGSQSRASVGATGKSEATVCVRLDPGVDCAGYDLVLDLPAEFGRDGAEVELKGIAHDDGPARRVGQSSAKLVTVRDTTPPTVQLEQPDSVQPDRHLSLRVRIFDRHSGAGRLSYSLRLLSNRCVASQVTGEVTTFIPDGDDELAVIALPVPSGLSSGSVVVEDLAVLDGAEIPNRGQLEASTVCIGACGDQTPPNVEIVSVHQLVDGEEPRALSAGDGVPPGARLSVVMRSDDELSALRQLWVQLTEDPPAPPADLQTCPGLPNSDERTTVLIAPEEVDGHAFAVHAGAYDDVGHGSDHNLGLAEPFPLVIRDEVPPTIDGLTLLNADGEPTPRPALGSVVRVSVDASDTFGRIASLQLRVDDQDGQQAAISAEETLDPAPAVLTNYASPTTIQLPNPNDRRATADWTMHLTLWDDATPPNEHTVTLPFLPTDTQVPNITQINGGGDLNLSNGRAATVRISGNDTARFIDQAALTDLNVGQTGVSAADVTVAVAAGSAAVAAQAVSIAVPVDAREGQISARPRLRDDSGNSTTGDPVAFNLVDDVPPVIHAVFNPNVLLPGGEVRLEVQASDVNSGGIARMAVGPTQHIAWNSTSVSNVGSAVFTGTVSEDPGVIGAGLPITATVTVTDRAVGANQATADASATLRDQAGPIITILEVPDGPVDGATTMRIRATDHNGRVASTGYSVSLRRFGGGEVTVDDTISYGNNEQVQSITENFVVAIPRDIEEGDYPVIFSATDAEGNLSQVTSAGQHRLTVVDGDAPHGLSFRSVPSRLLTSGTSTIVVRAKDRASGVSRVTLRAVGAGLDTTLSHDCAGVPGQCDHSFSLPVPAAAVHDGTVTLTLTARDGAAAPNEASIDTNVNVRDVDAPIGVAFTNPLPVRVATGGSIDLRITGQDHSSGLRRASFTAPCGSISNVDFPGNPTQLTTFFSSWSIPADCDAIGAQSIGIVLSDVSGHSPDASASLAVTVVDSTAPVVEFRSPPNSANTGADIAINTRISDGGSGAATMTLSTTCGTVVGGGVASFPGNPTGNSDHSFTVGSTENCPPGPITLTLTGTDASGNNAAAVQHQITMVDDDPPVVSFITAAGSLADVGGSIDLSISAQDVSSGLSSLTISVPCGTISAPHPVSFNGETGLQQVVRTWTIPADCRDIGSQTVTAVASDNSDSSDDGSATVSLTLRDLTAPTAAWSNPPATVSLSTGVTMTASGTDPSSGLALFEFSLDNPAQGSFDPTSVAVNGAPTSNDASSDLSVVSTLLHGASVAVQVQTRDVSSNVSVAAQHTLTVVDDIVPTAITATPQLDANRSLPGGRWAVAAGETVAIDLSASDANSGIATLNMTVAQNGQSNIVGNAAGAGASPFTTSEQVQAHGGLGDGDTVTITPRADDVSEATGFTDGTELVLVVDATPPAEAATITSPVNATIFGEAQSFGCLTAGNSSVSGTAGADAVSVMISVFPAPAGFPEQGLNVPVVDGAWTFSPDGYFWPNLTEMILSVRAVDAVGNVQQTGAEFTLRGDTTPVMWLPGVTVATSANNSLSGQADYQPILSGTRSQSTGGQHVVRGRMTCQEADGTFQADATPLVNTFAINEPNTISLGDANSASCAYELEESFCALIHTASGTATMTKVNAAPTAASNQTVDGAGDNPATIGSLTPTFVGQYNDPFDAGLNQITQSAQVQFRVYTQGGTPIWTSALTPVSVSSGGTASTTFPTWRPFNAGVGSGDGIALRRNDTVLWFPTGSQNPAVHVLDLNTNTWSSWTQNAIGGLADWSLADAIVLTNDDEFLRVTSNGDVLVGTIGAGSITWSQPGIHGSSPDCTARRASRGEDNSSRVLFWCRAVDDNQTNEDESNQLHSYWLDLRPNNTTYEFTALQISGAPIVAENFQAARLRHDSEVHYRVLPGTGADVQPLGAKLHALGVWQTTPTTTGETMTLQDGASIAATGTNMEYIVLDGDSGGWRIAGNATPSDDTAATFALPGAITMGASGHHLAAGNANHEAVALPFNNGLRPMQWVAADGNFSAPPDPNNNEQALQSGVSYSWDLRFDDEGGATGSFLGAGSDQAFTVQVN